MSVFMIANSGSIIKKIPPPTFSWASHYLTSTFNLQSVTSMNGSYKQGLLHSVLSFTCTSLMTCIGFGDDGAPLGSSSRGFRDATVSLINQYQSWPLLSEGILNAHPQMRGKSRIELLCLYVSAQVVFALCEQLEDLEMRSGSTKFMALLTFARL